MRKNIIYLFNIIILTFTCSIYAGGKFQDQATIHIRAVIHKTLDVSFNQSPSEVTQANNQTVSLGSIGVSSNNKVPFHLVLDEQSQALLKSMQSIKLQLSSSITPGFTSNILSPNSSINTPLLKKEPGSSNQQFSGELLLLNSAPSTSEGATIPLVLRFIPDI